MLWQITSSSSSTSSLIAAKSRPTSTKNWEAAFGDLSSQYGFGGNVPSLPQKAKKSTRASTKPSKILMPTTQPQSESAPQPKKNYEAAFGQLASSYGFGGGFSSLPSRK